MAKVTLALKVSIAKVIFNRINIVKSSVDGIWMTGLGSQADIITLGQGFVRIGDEVEPVYSNEQE
jgi:multidrug efflux system membrane fusion protein